jgi:hypothetical protein
MGQMNQGLSALYSMLKGISPRFRIFRQKTGSLSSDINGQVLPPSSFHSEFYLVSSGHRKPDVPIMAGVCRLFTYGACTEAGWLKSTKFVLHCDLFDAIRFNVVKQLIAILFSMLLVWMQITPTSVPASPVCVKPAMGNCADCCDRMACCATKPASQPQPSPAVPTQSTAQNQISLLASSVVAWTLPENSTGSKFSISTSPLLTMAPPLYERNCALLL